MYDYDNRAGRFRRGPGIPGQFVIASSLKPYCYLFEALLLPRFHLGFREKQRLHRGATEDPKRRQRGEIEE
jgi:hypothetical protein